MAAKSATYLRLAL